MKIKFDGYTAFARLNSAGYWVGCICYPDNTVSEVTNAKHTHGAALDVAARMIDSITESTDKEIRRTQKRSF